MSKNVGVTLRYEYKPASTTFNYDNARKFSPKGETRQSKPKVCKYCQLPKKAKCRSARTLTSYTVFVGGRPLDRSTAANKSDFDFDRRMEFCNPLTCDGAPARKDYTTVYELARIDLGDNFSRKQFKRWMKGTDMSD